MIVNTGINSAQLFHAILTTQRMWNKKTTEDLLHGNAMSTNTSATNVIYNIFTQQDNY